MDIYKNQKLMDAFAIYVERQNALLPSEEEWSDAPLSPEFEARMQKLLAYHRHGYYALFGTVGRRVASIVVALLVSQFSKPADTSFMSPVLLPEELNMELKFLTLPVSQLLRSMFTRFLAPLKNQLISSTVEVSQFWMCTISSSRRPVQRWNIPHRFFMLDRFQFSKPSRVSRA